MKRTLHFVHFVLAEDEADDQNTGRPSGRLEPLANCPSGCVKSRSTGGSKIRRCVKGICKNAEDGGKIRGGLPSAWVSWRVSGRVRGHPGNALREGTKPMTQFLMTLL